MPLPIVVRMSRCSLPVSPITRRAALMRLPKVDSETIRPPQTEASRSSLLTTRSRLPTRKTKRSNTCGSTAVNAASRRSSPSGGENTVFKSIQHFPAHSDRNRPPRCASASLTRVASFENQHHLKEISTPPQSRVDRPLVSSYAFRLTSGEGLKPSDTNGMRDAALHTFVRHLSSDLRNFDGSAATHCHKPTD